MKIKTLEAYALRLPLTKPYTIAYKTIVDTELIFFEVTLENGMTGIGAANPFPEVVGETSEITLANLKSDFVQAYVGRDIRTFHQLIDEAAAHFPQRPGTLAAIDIALHDAFGKFLGIPILDYYGRKFNSLPTSITIGIKSVEEMMEEAKEYYASGFRILKIKTGLDVEEDIERVQRLSEYFGGHMMLRVDANQGYKLKDLLYFMWHTKGAYIELIEQPVRVGKEDKLLKMIDEDRQYLVADESLLDAQSAFELSIPPAPFGVFNIKLMKSGGIQEARRIATIAEAGDIELFWGCNDESIVSITAAIHAAFSCPNTRYLDLDGSFDLSRDLVTGGFRVEDGYMYPLDKPGLGLEKNC